MDKKLEIINQSAYLFNRDSHEKFNDICAPLYALGVPRFSYSIGFKNGSYLSLDSSQDYLKQYLSQIRTPGSIFVNQLKFLKKFQRIIFIPSNNIEKFDKTADPTMHLLYDNDIWNNLYIATFDNEEYLELFGFSMTRSYTDAANFYANNIKLFERFTQYFKAKASDLIDTKDKSKLAYFDHGLNFGSGLTDYSLENRLKNFLEETRIKNLHLLKNCRGGLVKLAPREIECLEYMVLGKSVKEIANVLELSPRTVEFYLAKAKQKTGYNVKQKLINKLLVKK